jgi:2-hydroxy-6-oxonona-2,4-dienedioate hydrolase
VDEMRGKRLTLAIAGGLLAGFGAFAYSEYSRDIRAARARVSSGSNVLYTPCGRIEYAEAGNGPPVLVIHGAGGGFDQGLELAQPLIAAGFRVIAVSRFGYLRTPMPAVASPEAQADAHACLLDALKIGRVAVIGGSAGAPSAMQLCLRHPERCSALVLLFPMAFAPDRAQVKPSALFSFVIKATLHSDFPFWAATKITPNTLIKTVLGTPVQDFRAASRDEQERALEVMRHILPVSQREKGIWNDATISPVLPRFDLERFNVPTLLISAEDDLYGTYPSAGYTAAQISGARFVGYPTRGHLLLGHWMEASSEVVAFFQKVPWPVCDRGFWSTAALAAQRYYFRIARHPTGAGGKNNWTSGPELSPSTAFDLYPLEPKAPKSRLAGL